MAWSLCCHIILLLLYSKWQASPWRSYMNFCTGDELPEAANISVYQEFLNLKANLSFQNLLPIFMVSGKRLWVGPLGTSLLSLEMSFGRAYPLVMRESWCYVPFLLEPRWPLCHSAPLPVFSIVQYEEHGFCGVKCTWVWILALPLSRNVTFS